jgi:ankyrin repeat protein
MLGWDWYEKGLGYMRPAESRKWTKTMGAVRVCLIAFFLIYVILLLIAFIPYVHSEIQYHALIRASRRDLNHSSPLILACYAKSFPMVQRLLEEGADINQQNARGFTALMIAADDDQLEIVKLLLARGADVKLRTNLHKSALYYAAGSRPEIIQLLLDHGADARSESGALARAVTCSESPDVRLLVLAGADVKESDPDGRTVLMWAAQWTSPENVGLLLDHGADVHARQKHGWTAMMFASHRPENIQVLLQYGGDPNARDTHNASVLEMARQEGEEETVRLLKRAGAKE